MRAAVAPEPSPDEPCTRQGVHHAHSGGGPGSGGKRHTLPIGAAGNRLPRHRCALSPARSGFISRPDPDHAAGRRGRRRLHALVQRSHAIWRSLESQAQTRLLHTCGGLVFGGRHERLQAHGSADFLQTTCDVASQHRIQHERLDAHQMQSRFPAFCFEGDEEGYYEPEAGYVMPERCIEVQLGEAKRLGAAITTGCRMTGWHSIKGGYRVETAKGAFDCETLILCTGPWVADALHPTLKDHATPYRQVLHWFEPGGPGEWFEPGTMPVFIRVPYRGHEMIYGFPEVKGPVVA